VLADRLAERRRCCEYRNASFSAAGRSPTPRAATLMRPSSRPPTACWKPRPSTPPTRPRGRDAEVLEHELGAVDRAVAELFQLASDREPVALLGDEHAHALVAGLGLGSVFASTAKHVPYTPFVIQVFVPFST
jgi:hypothetical protein